MFTLLKDGNDIYISNSVHIANDSNDIYISNSVHIAIATTFTLATVFTLLKDGNDIYISNSVHIANDSNDIYISNSVHIVKRWQRYLHQQQCSHYWKGPPVKKSPLIFRPF